MGWRVVANAGPCDCVVRLLSASAAPHVVSAFIQGGISMGFGFKGPRAGQVIADEAALRTVYPEVSNPVRDKAIDHIDDFARQFIALSPFFCIGSSRPDSLADVSPRGGEPGFVHVLDDKRIAFPDRPGNNRLDTLTNLVHAPAAGLLFLIPGFEETLRINGTASITTDAELMERFMADGKLPRSVIVVEVVEVYLHCSKALKRSELWNPDKRIDRSVLPTWGQMLRKQGRAFVPAKLIDFVIGQDAKRNLY
ncbi:pyridoxamine 5'-phosphate oxidase family protein [Rhodopseudomonas sp. HC1]|uniref:MSMEG_1061 family FMN-dependent PPOX-type flavoprotein n=1 Tax=Rhodopseudomonas infernalis TaxID=2897386 RepID=UPI001EE8413F|nr:MSMEG_1061 family FMN-dependent PPOX-type flavoprotein [Rhodopseudomonas infernalis]MCG6204311.1 pyridoxamine 5'-phosphate oxidase family protein [Rhodopseudomonas infernalis]